jgi:hypothetical protein
MKAASLSLILMMFCHWVAAQDIYTVIKVSGKVARQEGGKPLANGDKIQINNALTFNSPEDYVIVVSPNSGSQLINGVPERKPYEFIQLLQTYVKPQKKSSAYRSVNTSYISELKGMLSSTILVLGDGQIMVDTDQLSLKRPACIMAQYRLGKVYYRKISDDRSFYLSKKSIFGTGDIPVESTVALYYCEDESEDPLFGNSTIIGNIFPVYPNEDELLDEIKTLIAVLSGNALTGEQLTSEIKHYLELGYAQVIDQNLLTWLSLNGLVAK